MVKPTAKQSLNKPPAGLGKPGTAAYTRNLAAMELLVRAGKHTYDAIGKQFGVSKGRVSQLAKEHGWERDLQPQITARAAAKVSAHVAAADQAAAGAEAVVEANAEVLARIVLAQRRDAVKAREVVNGLLGELVEVSANSSKPVKKGEPKAMDLPARVDVARKLVETLKTAITLERVVHGIADDTPIDGSKRVAEAFDNGMAGLKAKFNEVLKK